MLIDGNYNATDAPNRRPMEWLMRVTGSSGPRIGPPDSGRPAPTPGFRLSGPASAAPPSPASAPSATGALLGLQDIALPAADRRRRAIRRGQSLLDRLDELRRGLLDGAVPLAALQGLRSELGRAAGLDGDARLRGLLDAIDVRCAVEIAKLEGAGTIG